MASKSPLFIPLIASPYETRQPAERLLHAESRGAGPSACRGHGQALPEWISSGGIQSKDERTTGRGKSTPPSAAQKRRDSNETPCPHESRWPLQPVCLRGKKSGGGSSLTHDAQTTNGRAVNGHKSSPSRRHDGESTSTSRPLLAEREVISQ